MVRHMPKGTIATVYSTW